MSLKIKTALISVSDKSNLRTILPILKKYKIKILSSGGTFKIIKNLGYKCVDISEYTKFPEILDGRVKTLHPKIHAGILAKKKDISHRKQLRKLGFDNIELVIVNFYPFEETLNSKKNHKRIIENIDIGGPAMVRAAAKNYESTTIVTSTNQYDELKEELKKNKGSTSKNFRLKLSQQAFLETAYYDSAISKYFSETSSETFPSKKIIFGKKISDLRYGENPHQKAAIYSYGESHIKQLSGKKLSFNNINDLYNAILVSKTLPKNKGCVVIKHSNPSGVSISKNKLNSLKQAVKCDPVSAYGGIISCNFKIDETVAKELNKIFLEIVIGNGFSSNALKILKEKQNLRIIDAKNINLKKIQNFVSNFNSFLIQSSDIEPFTERNFKVVSKKKPNKEILKNLIFAFNVCRFVKSNAIVITRDFSTIGIGSGQTSRVDSCKLAIKKMKDFNLDNLSGYKFAASDAFFPFTDGIKELAFAGVDAIIQPSGSIRDKEIIKIANKLRIILVFSKTRHFKH